MSTIELVNYNHPSGEGNMTQVKPVQPEKVDINLPESTVDLSESSHITLHQAARDGRADVINHRLFKVGRSERRAKIINKLDDDSISPMHYAVRYGHVPIVKILMDNEADVNIEGLDGASPLHYAARFFSTSLKSRHQSSNSVDGIQPEPSKEDANIIGGLRAAITEDSDAVSLGGDVEESIIDYLLSVGANINARDSYGMTPLHYAANKSNVLAVNELLQNDQIKVDERDSSSATPLHAACNEGSLMVVKSLVNKGADIRAKDYENTTPILCACSEGHLEVVQYLLDVAEERGGQHLVESLLSDKNSEKEAALHAATDGGYLDVVELCIRKGSNVRDVRSNNTQPLHLAATSGKVRIAKLLIEHGANIEARNFSHETPLHRAACFNRVIFVNYLLDCGAKIESRDKDNFTPLLSAASEGHTKVVTTLLKRGANLRAEDIHNKTAIYMAAEENCVDALKEILNHPVSTSLINKNDLYEDTPLHVAAGKGFVVVAELLLEKGARIDARNDEEYTPLHLAAKNGRTKTVSALLKRDSDIINDEDDSSNTPLHLASAEGHWKSARELLENGSPVDARNVNLWTPLDCAAANGHTKTAAMLLDYDSPVDPTDKAKTTPLHLASRAGHVDMVILLLSKNADIAFTDHTGRNCLDMAVDYGQKEVAAAIVKSKNWKDAMRNKTFEQGKVTTPMRKLILKLPDVAEIVLNQSVTDNGLPIYHHDYAIHMNYEFLEDVYADWYPDTGGSMGSETSSLRSLQLEKSEMGYQAIEDDNMKEQAIKQLEKKSNHPLTVMIKRKRETLASHPVISFLLHNKWHKYGRYLYYLKLLIYIIFLFFLTGYSILTTQHQPIKLTDGNCSINKPIDSGEHKFFVEVGSVVVIVLACWHILMEIFQFVYQKQHYLRRWENLLELVTYISTIVYVAPEFSESDYFGLQKSCTSGQQSVGAVAIFCAWMSLLLFIRKFPKLGIYVVMFTDILYTFTKFSLIFVLFIVAFALSFYNLFSQTPSFNSAGRSMIKTGVMMIGEFDFDNLYGPGVPPLSWLLFIIFLIVMTLILMNLLIGLAVDDIKGVQDQAVLKRQAMLVDLALDVEKAMPRKLRKSLLVLNQTFYPNQYKGFLKFWSQPPISPQEMKEALELEKTPMQQLQDHNESLEKSMKGLKGRMKEMQSQQEQLQAMLQAVINKLEITLEDDAPDDEEGFLLKSILGL